MSNSKNIAVRLSDFAAQENCDGEPYDTMQAASEYIRELETQLETEREKVRALREALEDIKAWTDRWTTPGHPVSNVARKALATTEPEDV